MKAFSVEKDIVQQHDAKGSETLRLVVDSSGKIVQPVSIRCDGRKYSDGPEWKRVPVDGYLYECRFDSEHLLLRKKGYLIGHNGQLNTLVDDKLYMLMYLLEVNYGTSDIEELIAKHMPESIVDERQRLFHNLFVAYFPQLFTHDKEDGKYTIKDYSLKIVETERELPALVDTREQLSKTTGYMRVVYHQSLWGKIAVRETIASTGNKDVIVYARKQKITSLRKMQEELAKPGNKSS